MTLKLKGPATIDGATTISTGNLVVSTGNITLTAGTATTPSGLDSVKGGFMRMHIDSLGADITQNPPTQKFSGVAPCLAFNDTTQNNAFYAFQLPPDIDLTVDVVLELEYTMAGTNTGTKNIVLGLDVLGVTTGDTVTAAATTTTETILIVNTANTATFITTTTGTGCRIPAASMTGKSAIHFKFYRKAADVNDTAVGDWQLFDFRLKYKRL